jgi:ABC-2 type transport system permease protein
VPDSHRTPAHAPFWRSFRTAAWLGWQIESNWADPLLFVVYSIAKPLALASILVVIYATVTQANFESPVFAYVYLGNAFYLYVGAVMAGMAHAVIDDRERYRMLKSVYVAPIDFRSYLVGRGAARFLTGSLSVLITLIVGVFWLHLPLDLTSVNWTLFLVSQLIGIVMLAAMGLVLAGVVLLIGYESWSVGDAVAGTMYLFSGAIFPLEVLPAYLRPIGLLLPVTYWLELTRRALVGSVAQAFPPLADLSDARLIGILAALTSALCLAALLVFRLCDSTARERGLLDRTTNY